MSTSSGSDFSQTAYQYTYKTALSSGPTSGSTDRSLACTWTKTGVSVPHWKILIKRGQDAGSDFSGTKVSDFVSEGVSSFGYQILISGIWRTVYSNAQGLPLTVSTIVESLPADSTTVLNVAKARFCQEIRDTNTSLQGGVVLGELGETLRMIRHPFKTMYEDVPRYLAKLNRRTRKVRNRAQARKIVADTWLEQAFGWRPLMSDIRDGCEALNRMKSGPLDVRQKVRATNEKETCVTTQVVTRGKAISVSPYYNVYKKQSTLVQYVLTGGVKIKDRSRSMMAQRLLGFTLDDFVPTLYELMPWSFLIDYFSNLGDVISSWSLNHSGLYYWNKTRRLSATVDQYHWPDIAYTLSTVTGSDYKGQYCSASPSRRVTENKSVVRDAKPQESLIPDFQLEFPGMSMKWLNIAALAATRDRSRNTFSRLG